LFLFYNKFLHECSAINLITAYIETGKASKQKVGSSRKNRTQEKATKNDE